MNIIEPKVELWEQGNDPVSHIAKCARVCYGKTEGKSTDQQLYDNLRKAKHNSMFRHESVYAIVPFMYYTEEIISHYLKCPYLQIVYSTAQYYIATNMNFIIDHSNKFGADDISHLLLDYRKTPAEFCQFEIGWNMMRYTFHITTQISTSRELNRVSPNNIAERSSRYVREDGTIVRPHWMNKDWVYGLQDFYDPNDDIPLYAHNYVLSCIESFGKYDILIGEGMKRQDARGVLPLDTATEVVYTYSVDEWRHIVELRSDKRAHPNAQIIANMIKKELEGLGYDFE